MGRFDGILLCTDLDGTLLRNDGTISSENVRAIEYFKAEGGAFTFITGRMPFFVEHIYDRVKPNVPIGCVNGGGLYDYPAQRYIWTASVPHGAVDLIACADAAFADLGIQVYTFDRLYFCRENQTMRDFRARTGLPHTVCRYDAVREPIAKIVFGSESEADILRLEQLLRAHPLADTVSFIRSEKTLFEIMPRGVGKGTALEQLVHRLHTDIRRTVAIGDYNNDISMLETAGLGIAVSNACAQTLAAADRVTVSNEEHAVARVIYGLRDGEYVL